jgi:hypothetical protein
VREALRLMKGRGDLARLRIDVHSGFDEVSRGEGIEYPRASRRRLADDTKARGKSALAVKRDDLRARTAHRQRSGNLVAAPC